MFLALFRQANNNLSRRKFFTRISYGEEGERLDGAVEELSRSNTPVEDQGSVDWRGLKRAKEGRGENAEIKKEIVEREPGRRHPRRPHRPR